MISILDYGAGNLRSVENTLSEIGADYELVQDAAGIERASKILLPGVGHFAQMVRAIDELGIRSKLLERLDAGVPFLGICLGLQALFAGSEEAPDARGFALFPETIQRFTGDIRVPHMGWDRISPTRESPLLRGVGEAPHVYFAHSYYAPAIADASATCEYGTPFTAVLERHNIFGVQFHPEKSGPLGLRIVRNFLDL